MNDFIILTHDQLLGFAFLGLSVGTLLTLALNILYGAHRVIADLEERIWHTEEQNDNLLTLLDHEYQRQHEAQAQAMRDAMPAFKAAMADEIPF